MKRLLKSGSFHSLVHVDDDGHAESLDEGNLCPDLANWIKCIPKEETVKMVRSDSGVFLLGKDGQGRLAAIEITTNRFIDSDRGNLEYFFELLYAHETPELRFSKMVETVDEYNQRIQYSSEEDTVYPVECGECGCLMGVSRDHWEEHNHGWARAKCTNINCGNIDISAEFLEKITRNNKRKIVERAKQDLSVFYSRLSGWDYLKVYQGDAASQYPGPDNSDDHRCRECGNNKNITYQAALADDTYLVTTVCCSRCFGNISGLLCDVANLPDKQRNIGSIQLPVPATQL